MKIRRFVAAAVLALGVFVAPAAASAHEHTEPGADSGDVDAGENTGAESEPETGEAGGEKKIGHAEEECIHLLEAGGKIDDCQEAPSLILPETNEIVFGGLAFLLVFLALWKLALPGIKQTMEDRSNRIREGLDEAERTKAEAQTVLEQYQHQLADARNEANRIIEEARQTADNLRADLMARAEQEVNELKARSREEIDAAKNRALSEVQSQVTNLSIDLAEKIVERSLDRETNRQLVESYIRELETR